MKVKFANGVVKGCSSPTEQKIFKSNSGVSGWALSLRLIGKITSTELDEILTVENIASLEFLTEDENGENKTIFTLNGYDKITSSIIRHAEETTSTTVDIQVSKGV